MVTAKTLEWVVVETHVLHFSELIRGPNNETVSNDSTTFHLLEYDYGTVVDERILEVAVVSGHQAYLPYYGHRFIKQIFN